MDDGDLASRRLDDRDGEVDRGQLEIDDCCHVRGERALARTWARPLGARAGDDAAGAVAGGRIDGDEGAG